MAIRGIGDAYAFQRLLWLLVGTVVVPTALLALYGVVAIRNERHAMGERVRLERVERSLRVSLESAVSAGAWSSVASIATLLQLVER